MPADDNETWLMEAGDLVIEAKAANGFGSLSPFERLLYCLWVADYGMRNAGDLTAADELFESWLADGKTATGQLALPRASSAFALSPGAFEQRYFELFGPLVEEMRAAAPPHLAL